MSFRTLPLPKQFATEYDFGFKNLIVSGCSFTYNDSDTDLCSWPYYLRDLGGFRQVFDTSLPGAGNYHISTSLQWELESQDINPTQSLVIVMWSGNDRDDYICPDKNTKHYPVTYRFSSDAVSGITGGIAGQGNALQGLRQLAETKTKQSRAVENFLHVNSLYHYLKAKQFKFVFLNFMNRNSLNHGDFEIDPLLPKLLQKKYRSYMSDTQFLYDWAVKHDFLSGDNYHPTPNGHLVWTRQVLIPMLQSTHEISTD